MKEKIKNLFNREKKEDSPEVKKRKTIIFFGFYLIFFTFLIIYIRSYKDDLKVTETDNVLYKTELIENGTYSSRYTIIENEDTYTFEIKKDDENYEASEYKYKNLLDIYTIKRIIKNSKYILKTESGTGYINYRYEIANNSLADILNQNSNIENEANPLTIYVDKDKNIYQIDMDLSNYMKINEDYEVYKLTIEYGAFENEESSTN